MKLKSLAIFLILMLTTGCETVIQGTMECSSVSPEEHERFQTDLNQLLVSYGFKSGSLGITNTTDSWDIDSTCPLWKGRGEVQVALHRYPTQSRVDIFLYSGAYSARDALTQKITDLVKRDAPGVIIKTSTKRSIGPSFLKV